MFKICPNCGAHNLVTANFCVKCGTNLADVAVAQEQADTASHTAPAEKPATSSASQSTAPISAAKEAVRDETANSVSTTATQSTAANPSQTPHKPATSTATASTNTNTNSGAENSQTVAQTPAAPKQPNPTVEAGKQYAGSYWRYLVDSIKHPAQIDQSYHPYFGFTSLAITIISLALTIALRVSSTLSSLPGGVANIVLSTFIKLFVMVAILAVAIIAIYYLAIRGILGDRRRNFLEFTTAYAFHANWMVFFSLFTLLMQIVGLINVGSAMLLTLLVALSLGLFLLAGPYMLFTAQPTNQFDKIYAYLIASALLFLVFMVVGMLGLSSIISSLYQGINDIGRSFNY
ncbi:zinc-ribbon domain-containing protein [Lacticaseibacillus zeae]|uniref:Zinc-ribbon domain-containing protein n=1 Tax=Lacticaseibacillus zeae TaxID=57037 RepID=A0A5R8LT86_LACZE|nr:zinc-ribbon domain-containing protein [Lacticaseibacillus zeae]TLF40459.1 zinc-ribbon domain-containing protein [Lacticaseibacillus zeae]